MLAATTRHIGSAVLQKWGLASALLTAATTLALLTLGIPLHVWPPILLLPTFPLLLSASLILMGPVFSVPQRWILAGDGVHGRGVPGLGRIRWADIREWSIEPLAGLTGHYAVRFRWSSKYGMASAAETIYVPPSVDIARVERSFRIMTRTPPTSSLTRSTLLDDGRSL